MGETITGCGITMKATLLKVSEMPSKFGGKCYLACFKCEDGKSRRSWWYPSYSNFNRWKSFISRENVELDGLNTKGTLIDADSYPREIRGDICSMSTSGT